MPILPLLVSGIWSLGAIIGHDPGAYTQGLELRGTVLFESTGLYGQSSIRRVDPATGEVTSMTRLPDSLFAEGLTLTSPSRMLVLTWRENLILVVNPATLQITETLPLQGEGWGLCYDGTSVIRSDGTSTLYFHDPKTMEVKYTITVELSGAPQSDLNELEYTRGYIWANQWLSSRILTIDPVTGQVLCVTDFSSITPPGSGAMNGIAYLPETDHFLITGKNWPVMYTVDIQFDGQ